jgi:hypothetical protein
VEISKTLFEWREVPPTARGWSDSMWAIGPAEAWAAHQRGEAPRTSPAFASHIVEVLTAIEAATGSGELIELESSTERPLPLTCDYGPDLWARGFN